MKKLKLVISPNHLDYQETNTLQNAFKAADYKVEYINSYGWHCSKRQGLLKFFVKKHYYGDVGASLRNQLAELYRNQNSKSKPTTIELLITT